MSTYNEFLMDNRNCSKFAENDDAMHIFSIINSEQNIGIMKNLCECGTPALAACLSEIESYVESKKNSTINLEDGFTRQAIGLMVRTVLSDEGYHVTTQKTLSKSLHSKYFLSASCFAKTFANDDIKTTLESDNELVFQKNGRAYSNLHLMYTITFFDDDSYQTNQVEINGIRYSYIHKYEYRSQGNIHLLFLSEDGCWFSLSFDGHKGNVYYCRNEIVAALVDKLNNKKSQQSWVENKPNEIYDELLNCRI